MQYQAQNAMAAANEKSTLASYQAQMGQLQLQRGQINQQASENESEVAKAEQAKMAQLRVAAGESGVSGNSVERSANELTQSLSQDNATLEGNRKNTINQTSAQALGIRAQSQSQMNSVRRGNLVESGLKIATAYYGSQAATPNTSGSGVQTGGKP